MCTEGGSALGLLKALCSVSVLVGDVASSFDLLASKQGTEGGASTQLRFAVTCSQLGRDGSKPSSVLVTAISIDTGGTVTVIWADSAVKRSCSLETEGVPTLQKGDGRHGSRTRSEPRQGGRGRCWAVAAIFARPVTAKIGPKASESRREGSGP